MAGGARLEKTHAAPLIHFGSDHPPPADGASSMEALLAVWGGAVRQCQQRWAPVGPARLTLGDGKPADQPADRVDPALALPALLTAGPQRRTWQGPRTRLDAPQPSLAASFFTPETALPGFDRCCTLDPGRRQLAAATPETWASGCVYFAAAYSRKAGLGGCRRWWEGG